MSIQRESVRAEVTPLGRDHSSIARIAVDGERGSAVLVDDDLMLTALHVIARIPVDGGSPRFRPGIIKASFQDFECEASVVPDGWDTRDDWAILRCAKKPGLMPLPIRELTESPVNCWSYGFSNRQPIDGMIYEGEWSITVRT
jgi:hypothetical protein